MSAPVYSADVGGRCACGRRRCLPGCGARAVRDPIGRPAYIARRLQHALQDLDEIARDPDRAASRVPLIRLALADVLAEIGERPA